MYKICYHVPESHLDITKQALFSAGAGRVGAYEHCCWQVLGQGQFRPLPGSQPHTGAIGQLAQTSEYLVELVCEAPLINDALIALRMAHPYETPSVQVLQMVSIDLESSI